MLISGGGGRERTSLVQPLGFLPLSPRRKQLSHHVGTVLLPPVAVTVLVTLCPKSLFIPPFISSFSLLFCFLFVCFPSFKTSFECNRLSNSLSGQLARVALAACILGTVLGWSREFLGLRWPREALGGERGGSVVALNLGKGLCSAGLEMSSWQCPPPRRALRVTQPCGSLSRCHRAPMGHGEGKRGGGTGRPTFQCGSYGGPVKTPLPLPNAFGTLVRKERRVLGKGCCEKSGGGWLLWGWGGRGLLFLAFREGDGAVV